MNDLHMQPIALRLLRDVDATSNLDDGSEQQYTLQLRISAIFVILVAALVAGLPLTLLRLFENPDAVAGRVARVFSGGVMLGLSLVSAIK